MVMMFVLYRASLDPLDHQVHMDQLDQMDYQVMMVYLDHQASRYVCLSDENEIIDINIYEKLVIYLAEALLCMCVQKVKLEAIGVHIYHILYKYQCCRAT